MFKHTVFAAYLLFSLLGIDTFNRSNGGLGANWTSTTTATLQIVSNSVQTNTLNASSHSYYNGSGFTANQYSKIQVAAQATGNCGSGATVRQSGTPGNESFYQLATSGALGAGSSVTLSKTVAGTFTTIHSYPVTLALNDTLMISVVGTTITSYQNGVILGTQTDAAVSTGNPGISVFVPTGGALTDCALDNWVGGKVNVSMGGSPTTAQTWPAFGSYLIGAPQNYDSSAVQGYMSRMVLNVIGTWDGWQSGRSQNIAQVTTNIQNNSPSTVNSKVVFYTILAPQGCTAVSGNANFGIVTTANSGQWWLYNSYPGGTKITGGYFGGQCGLNLAIGGNTVNGRNAMRYMVDQLFDFSHLGGALGLALNTNTVNPTSNGLYLDNLLPSTQIAGDYLRTGSSQSSGNSAASLAVRQAEAQFFGYIAANYPGMLITANTSGSANVAAVTTEYNGMLHGGVLEGMLGFSWSQINFSSFAVSNAEYQKQMALMIAPKYGIFIHGGLTTTGQTPTGWNGTTGVPNAWGPNYQGMRFGLTWSLTCGDALYGPSLTTSAGPGNPYTPTNANTLWFDEFSVNPVTNVANSYTNAVNNMGYLGAATQAAQTTPFQNGMYRRTYQNGEVWMNPPGNGTQTATYGRTVFHINGTQAPSYNNGASVTSDSILPADGRIVLYQLLIPAFFGRRRKGENDNRLDLKRAA